MDYTKKRWQVLIASCLVNLCIGSLYAWSVFAGPLLEKLNSFGAGLTSISIVFTVANSVGPITMISGGFINDRIGPKWVIFFGGLLFGSGMILTGVMKTLGGIVITYGLMAGLAIGLIYGSTVSNCVKFFPDKKGFIGGLTTASYGISSVLVPPVVVKLNDIFGIQKTFLIVGLTMMAVICISSQMILKCPSDFLPENFRGNVNGSNAKVANFTWQEMLYSADFYLMFAILLCGAFSGLMIISSASGISREMMGMDAVKAATIVSVIALFNTAGRILAGYLSDRIGQINTIILSFCSSVLGQFCIFLASNGNMFFYLIGISVIGICFGAIMGVYPGFTAARFGPAHNSVNYGIVFIGFAVAGYFGPTIMNRIHTVTSKYSAAFLVAMGLCILGLVLTVVLRKKEKN